MTETKVKVEMRLSLVQALKVKAFNWNDCGPAAVVNTMRENGIVQVRAGGSGDKALETFQIVQAEIQKFLFESEKVKFETRQEIPQAAYEAFVIDVFYTE